MMDISTIIFLFIAGLAVGSSIGCIGVGGVVLVPILVQLLGLPIHQAISIAMASYILSGAAGTWSFARSKAVDWSNAKWLWLGAIPAAIAGSLVINVLPDLILKLIISVLIISSGVHALRRHPTDDFRKTSSLIPSTGLALGATTGFCSALTGTGGPVTLIPIMLWMHLPAALAIGLAQTIQLPIALVASTFYIARDGLVAPLPGLVVGIGLGLGTFPGSWIARQLDQFVLKRAVAVVLIGTGVFGIVGLIK
jgi:uncharacterized membrane protein YfcA